MAHPAGIYTTRSLRICRYHTGRTGLCSSEVGTDMVARGLGDGRSKDGASRCGCIYDISPFEHGCPTLRNKSVLFVLTGRTQVENPNIRAVQHPAKAASSGKSGKYKAAQMAADIGSVSAILNEYRNKDSAEPL